MRQCFLSALFSPKCLTDSTFRIYITVISDVVRDSLRGTLADGRIFNGHTLLREWFQRRLIAVFNSVSFWEDTDGLTVASVSIHLYFSEGRAVGSLIINTSLFDASCAVSPSPT